MASALVLALMMMEPTVTSEQAFRRLQVRVAVEKVPELSGAALAGRYTSTSKELAARVGGFLSGEDLYVCPDGSYVYTEWADVESTTVYDKGRWTVVSGLLQLTSDSDVTWSPRAERDYIAIRRPGQARSEILIVGTRRELPYFEQAAADDPAFQLLLAALVRVERLTASECRKVKVRLMQQSWKPEYFKTQSK
jgi:hypothetical protein